MSREDDFRTRMLADSALMAILTGSVYTSAGVGRDGITRTAAPDAFDPSTGFLQPAALVKQRGSVPDYQAVDPMEQIVSAAQVVEIWLYQDTNYDQIDAAMARLYTLFQGYRFSDTFEIELVNELNREKDEGALAGASLGRMDFAVYSIRS